MTAATMDDPTQPATVKVALRRSYRVWWVDGRQTTTRLFDGEAAGHRCVYCSLDDGALLPVGLITGLGEVVAHSECAERKSGDPSVEGDGPRISPVTARLAAPDAPTIAN